MSIPNVIGPLTADNAFFIGNIFNGAPFVINFATTTAGVKYYYWESNVNVAIGNPNFPIFVATKSGTGITIKDTVNSGFVTFIANYPFSVNGPSTTISISSQFNPWGDDVLFLSQAFYNLSLSGVTTSFKFGRQGSGAEGTTPGAMFIPATWFFCNTNGFVVVGGQQGGGKAQALANWFCFTNPSNPVCTSFPIFPSGFSVLSECQTLTPYPYCFADTTCGMGNNCKGPCPSNTSHDCELMGSNFVWWRSGWFIGLMVGLALIGILILIIVIVKVTKKKDVDSYEE
jgi:hypothetical protein